MKLIHKKRDGGLGETEVKPIVFAAVCELNGLEIDWHLTASVLAIELLQLKQEAEKAATVTGGSEIDEELESLFSQLGPGDRFDYVKVTRGGELLIGANSSHYLSVLRPFAAAIDEILVKIEGDKRRDAVLAGGKIEGDKRRAKESADMDIVDSRFDEGF